MLCRGYRSMEHILSCWWLTSWAWLWLEVKPWGATEHTNTQTTRPSAQDRLSKQTLNPEVETNSHACMHARPGGIHSLYHSSGPGCWHTHRQAHFTFHSSHTKLLADSLYKKEWLCNTHRHTTHPGWGMSFVVRRGMQVTSQWECEHGVQASAHTTSRHKHLCNCSFSGGSPWVFTSDPFKRAIQPQWSVLHELA